MVRAAALAAAAPHQAVALLPALHSVWTCNAAHKSGGANLGEGGGNSCGQCLQCRLEGAGGGARHVGLLTPLGCLQRCCSLLLLSSLLSASMQLTSARDLAMASQLSLGGSLRQSTNASETALAEALWLLLPATAVELATQPWPCCCWSTRLALA